MIIRRAQFSDFPHIAAIQTESWQDAYTEVLPEAYLANQIAEDLRLHWCAMDIQPADVVLVADDGELIGFIAIWCRPDPFIDNLHVKPSRRSEMIGSTLLKSAARLLIKQGHKTAYLWVIADNNRAIRLYERLGGVCTEKGLKSLFGYEVPNVKVEFRNLQTIVRQRPRNQLSPSSGRNWNAI